jgi:flavin reductase (DIM6/NTAB) family NADH-FMN oxidoreductase RutF
MTTHKDFCGIAPEIMDANVFKLIGSDWMLITAGTPDSFNTMTASWGSLGVLWNKNVCFCFVRPSRYTYQFMEKNDHFTLSFFEEKYRDVLDFCGSHSGRDTDKAKETKITPVKGHLGGVYFKEARLVMECTKIYFQDLNPAHFLDKEIAENYTRKDYHRMYVGEVAHCLVKHGAL